MCSVTVSSACPHALADTPSPAGMPAHSLAVAVWSYLHNTPCLPLCPLVVKANDVVGEEPATAHQRTVTACRSVQPWYCAQQLEDFVEAPCLKYRQTQHTWVCLHTSMAQQMLNTSSLHGSGNPHACTWHLHLHPTLETCQDSSAPSCSLTTGRGHAVYDAPG